jgi:Holliday junction resolvasome RuvABC endonuclease subunit
MIYQKQPRILAVAPSTRGFGYAIMEGRDRLVRYGRKLIIGNKNPRCLVQVEQLITFFRPDVVVLHNMTFKNCTRVPRIKKLNLKIIEAAKKRRIKVKLFSTEQIRDAFTADESGTEHGRAKIIAEQFPEELGPRLPPRRRAQDNEDARMDIFDAAALALAYFASAKK